MANVEGSSPYGSRAGTGAASIDLVIREIPVGREFTVEEIEKAVRDQSLPERSAIREHLRSLAQRGHLAKTDNGWQRVN